MSKSNSNAYKSKDETVISSNNEIFFSDVLKLWMDNNRIKLKGGTINKYENIISMHINPELGEKKLSEITTIMINNYLSHKLKNGRLDNNGGLSPSYVRSIVFVINSVLKFATEEQMCLPLKSSISKPRIDKKEFNIISIEEERKLRNYLCNDISPTKTGILISLYAGLRIGEVCALSWNDIDLNNNILHVRHTIARVKNEDSPTHSATRLVIDTPKTKSSKRDIPICSSLRPYLIESYKKSKSEYVISDTDSYVNPRTFEYRFHRIINKCNITRINYHTLRHTFATRCIEAGVDVKSLSEILGHSNVGITLNTYVHSSMNMKRVQIEKLASFNS